MARRRRGTGRRRRRQRRIRRKRKGQSVRVPQPVHLKRRPSENHGFSLYHLLLRPYTTLNPDQTTFPRRTLLHTNTYIFIESTESDRTRV